MESDEYARILGGRCQIIPYDSTPDIIANKIIVRGSSKFVKRIHDEHGSTCYKVPLSMERYKYNDYSKQINDLLNDNFFLTSWGELVHGGIHDLLRTKWGVESFFIRPNSGYKIFTGTTITHKWFTKELEVILDLPSTDKSMLSKSTQCIIAPRQAIFGEVRFLVGPNGIVGHSEYSEGFPKKNYVRAMEVVNSVPRIFDPFFTVDVCTNDEDEVKIVEVNSFNSAGLYDIKPLTVINAVEHFLNMGM